MQYKKDEKLGFSEGKVEIHTGQPRETKKKEPEDIEPNQIFFSQAAKTIKRTKVENALHPEQNNERLNTRPKKSLHLILIKSKPAHPRLLLSMHPIPFATPRM